MRLLIIEDERSLATVLKKGFEEHTFIVDLAFDGEDGLFLAENYSYDALILDIGLPEIDGFSLLRTLRRKGIATPVLMLTARRELKDKVAGLELGADDYILKPFDFPELLARVRSTIRRSKGKPSPIITVGDLSIDTNARLVRRGGKDIALSAKEFNYLEYLAINRNRVVSRSELIDHMYDTEYDFESNIVDVYISYLRNKIDKGQDKKLIHTVRGAGYVLTEGREFGG
jgi:DNA-binding response OmpR family regulator